jgi:hypothetical protein
MTKALHCGMCGTVRTFRRDSGLTNCDCGELVGWWVDAAKGVARLYALTPEARLLGRIVGINNRFLTAASRLATDAEHRQMHDHVTIAPGYLFDKSRRNCWVVLIAPGESNDTKWASRDEMEAKFQSLKPADDD